MNLKMMWQLFEFYKQRKQDGYNSERLAGLLYLLFEFFIRRWDFLSKEVFPALKQTERDQLINILKELLGYSEEATKIIAEHKKSFQDIHRKFAVLNEALKELSRTVN